jgi:hypothetical protein
VHPRPLGFSVFCFVRRWFGVRFELTVLLLTEIVSTVYYRLLLRHGQGPALRSACRLILRDEIGRLYRDPGTPPAPGVRVMAGCGSLFPDAWAGGGNHAVGEPRPGLRGRLHDPGFYREVWLELSRFIGHLRRDR